MSASSLRHHLPQLLEEVLDEDKGLPPVHLCPTYRFAQDRPIPVSSGHGFDVDDASCMAGSPSSRRLRCSDELHSHYLNGRDLTERSERSPAKLIQVHDWLGDVGISERKEPARLEPPGAQSPDHFIRIGVGGGDPQDLGADDLIRRSSLLFSRESITGARAGTRTGAEGSRDGEAEYDGPDKTKYAVGRAAHPGLRVVVSKHVVTNCFLSEIDRGHPTLAQLTLDTVAAFEGSVQAGDGVGGHGVRCLRPLGHGVSDAFLKPTEVPVGLVVNDSAQNGVQAVQRVQEID